MQDALVGDEGAARRAVRIQQPEKIEVAQRRSWGDGAPVRVGQQRQRGAEGEPARAGRGHEVVARGGDQFRPAREQQHRTLKRRQAEADRDLVEGARPGERPVAAPSASSASASSASSAPRRRARATDSSASTASRPASSGSASAAGALVWAARRRSHLQQRLLHRQRDRRRHLGLEQHDRRAIGDRQQVRGAEDAPHSLDSSSSESGDGASFTSSTWSPRSASVR